MRARPVLVLALLAALATAGCGNGRDGSAPAACLGGTAGYLRALRAAPGPVRLAGGTPISACLVEDQAAGELATVGEALVDAATRLDAAARAHPGGAANLRLGYLLGAARRGAEGTAGIHAELLRRLDVAAHYSPAGRLPASFKAAYRRGYAAGAAGG